MKILVATDDCGEAFAGPLVALADAVDDSAADDDRLPIVQRFVVFRQ